MDNLSLVRLYFAPTAMRRPTSWWRRLAPQNLGAYLLQQAKLHGVEQALLHRVIGGYVGARELGQARNKIASVHLPLCLELIGKEEILQAFLKSNRVQLEGTRIVFLRGEEARVGAEMDRQTLEESLRVDRRIASTKPDED